MRAVNAGFGRTWTAGVPRGRVEALLAKDVAPRQNMSYAPSYVRGRSLISLEQRWRRFREVAKLAVEVRVVDADTRPF